MVVHVDDFAWQRFRMTAAGTDLTSIQAAPESSWTTWAATTWASSRGACIATACLSGARFFDIFGELGSSALARADESAQKEESYDEGYYAFKTGLLQAACDDEERTDEMLALDLTMVVQGRHLDDARIPIVERRGRRGGRLGSARAPDSRLALVLAPLSGVYFELGRLSLYGAWQPRLSCLDRRSVQRAASQEHSCRYLKTNSGRSCTPR